MLQARLLKNWKDRFLYFLGFHRMDSYINCPDQTAIWEQRYPQHAVEATQFLDIINIAFLLGKKTRNKISPDDDIMQLYTACQAGLAAENMEIEHLLFMSEDAFSCSFPDDTVLDGRTFGDLFEEVMRRSKKDVSSSPG